MSSKVDLHVRADEHHRLPHSVPLLHRHSSKRAGGSRDCGQSWENSKIVKGDEYCKSEYFKNGCTNWTQLKMNRC